MNGEDGHQQDRRHWNTGKRNECPYEDREASDELYQNRKSGEQRWFRNSNCVQNVHE
jgi:hypothetical protein